MLTARLLKFGNSILSLNLILKPLLLTRLHAKNGRKDNYNENMFVKKMFGL